MTNESKSWQIGDVKITQLRESDMVLKPEILLANFDPDRVAQYSSWLKPYFIDDDGNILLPFQSFVIESPGKNIILDACMGNDRTLPMGFGKIKSNFLSDLEAIVNRKGVDIVMYTHFAFDHIGWGTMLENGEWVPTFPSAKHLFVREELDFWMSQVNKKKGKPEGEVLRLGLQPIIDAKRYEFVDKLIRKRVNRKGK